eukprot:TRINITY_DN59200_c0_g1_i1.p1 TRINITY_DN59200_c0_g1~~TRINITY_DN59200_c0_g1_i1.p1  ORF type:complete len:408 (+),score=15.73 TRINITY_DN59200_c0_g1_i1:101-1324(+)
MRGAVRFSRVSFFAHQKFSTRRRSNDSRWYDALHRFDELRCAGIRPDAIAYTGVIAACGKGRRWDMSLALIRDMESFRVNVDLVCRSAAINSCGLGRAWEIALSLLNGAPRSQGVDLVCVNACIAACARGLAWRNAVALVWEMPVWRVQPDVVSFNTAMGAFSLTIGDNPSGISDSWAWPLVLLTNMKNAALRPDPFSYSTAIGAAERSKRWQQALFVAWQARKCTRLTDAIGVLSAVGAAAAAGAWRSLCAYISAVRRTELATIRARGTLELKHVEGTMSTVGVIRRHASFPEHELRFLVRNALVPVADRLLTRNTSSFVLDHIYTFGREPIRDLCCLLEFSGCDSSSLPASSGGKPFQPVGTKVIAAVAHYVLSLDRQDGMTVCGQVSAETGLRQAAVWRTPACS